MIAAHLTSLGHGNTRLQNIKRCMRSIGPKMSCYKNGLGSFDGCPILVSSDGGEERNKLKKLGQEGVLALGSSQSGREEYPRNYLKSLAHLNTSLADAAANEKLKTSNLKDAVET